MNPSAPATESSAVPTTESAAVHVPATGTGVAPNRERLTHEAWCDVCRAKIVGVRYKCVNCMIYDLCEACERRLDAPAPVEPTRLGFTLSRPHNPLHVFLKIREPLPDYGFHRILPNLYAEVPGAGQRKVDHNKGGISNDPQRGSGKCRILGSQIQG